MAVTNPTTALIVTPGPTTMDYMPMSSLTTEDHTPDVQLPSITATNSFISATNPATAATTTKVSTPGTSENSLDAPSTSTRTIIAPTTGDVD
ncbi:hypothetical protein SprV_0100514100 [Sparganum proliferum]